jgi:hypothetical protein
MVRGSDKQSPRLDESLKHDTDSLTRGAPVEARADDARTQEGPGDDEPTPDALLVDGPDTGSDDALGHDEIEARSELATYLRPSVWPADRAALIECARQQHAPESLLERLGDLPDGTFDHTEAVWEALGGRVEYRA